MKKLQLACIFMASGFSTRFGANKLLAYFHGKPLFEAVLSQFPHELFFQSLVVTRYAEVAVGAVLHGCTVAENMDESGDAANTIRLGVNALASGTDGAMFIPCDQPFLSAESVAALVNDFSAHTDCIIALGHGGKSASPVIFPAALFKELASLPKNTAGKAVIRTHPTLLRVVECIVPRELWDIDTPADLRAVPADNAPQKKQHSGATEKIKNSKLKV